mmetsp:Transcript_13166/g.39818  ORF Transcript_13166/g.39818 Transcript_13166/m.39818 type:complete len:301 (-) Transcript_13166:454-1356(-)
MILSLRFFLLFFSSSSQVNVVATNNRQQAAARRRLRLPRTRIQSLLFFPHSRLQTTVSFAFCSCLWDPTNKNKTQRRQSSGDGCEGRIEETVFLCVAVGVAAELLLAVGCWLRQRSLERRRRRRAERNEGTRSCAPKKGRDLLPVDGEALVGAAAQEEGGRMGSLGGGEGAFSFFAFVCGSFLRGGGEEEGLAGRGEGGDHGVDRFQLGRFQVTTFPVRGPARGPGRRGQVLGVDAVDTPGRRPGAHVDFAIHSEELDVLVVSVPSRAVQRRLGELVRRRRDRVRKGRKVRHQAPAVRER